MIVPDKSIIDQDRSHRQEKFLKKRYPEFLQFLKDKYPDSHSIAESLYLYFHNIVSPLDNRCKICGNPVRFKGYSMGYAQYCSHKCTNRDPVILEKAYNNRILTNMEKFGAPCNFSTKESYEKCKKTWKEKYGVSNPMKNKNVQNRAKLTCLNRYGTEYAVQSEEVKIKSKRTKKNKYGDEFYTNTEQSQKTQIERYGGVGLASTKLQQKYKDTCLERYGVEHPILNHSISKKVSKTKTSIVIQSDNNILDVNEDGSGFVCKCPDNKCTICQDKIYEIPRYLYHQRIRTNIDPCIIRTPLSTIKNTKIEKFIHDILDKANISYETNNRKILNGKELDIYIPDKNIAIECNGIYWHSKKDSEYHYKKWKECLDQGIQLLTFWEDQIQQKSDIIKNILLSSLGIYDHKIGARSCEIRKVGGKEASDFLNHNHLQGNITGSYRIGLYYKDELISLMVFGKKRISLGNKKQDSDVFELYRFCNKLGWQIQGGASKLFKQFLSDYPKSPVESFSSNDISIGNLYKQLGFIKVSEQHQSYWYIDKDMKRYHRWTFRKDELVKNGADSKLTEEEITLELGLFRIYDSGQQKWRYGQCV